MSLPIVHVFDDTEELAHAAADAIVFTAVQAVSQRGSFHWAVAGGGTPKRTYAVLADPPHHGRFPWAETQIWLGDERCVPATDPASNHRMVLEQLIRPAEADPAGLHAFDTSIDPGRAAADYTRRLGELVPGNDSGTPVLDLVLLGLGGDAHTASWFPGSRFPVGWAAATETEHQGHRRLTVTPELVNGARRVLFLVSGATKRGALERVFDGPRDPLQIPAQRVAPVDGQVMWMIDREAAGQSFLD